jgi:cbb3-type cytochrome oxidase subunit 1
MTINCEAFAYAMALCGHAGWVYGSPTLAFPALNFSTAEVTFGRLRPLHTNVVILPLWGISWVFIIHSSPFKARMFSDVLSQVHFWGGN